MTRNTKGTCGDCDRWKPLHSTSRPRCGSCYNRWRKSADFVPSRQIWGLSMAEIIHNNSVPAPSGCLIWTGCNNGVYGQLSHNGKTLYAHRASYELHVGEIPQGFQVDHLCRRPRCIRPLHLDAVTPQVNVLRSQFTMAYKWSIRTHCKAGHEYAPENTAWVRSRSRDDKVYRSCKECRRLRGASRYAATRQARAS